jgi:hypothetical protein
MIFVLSVLFSYLIKFSNKILFLVIILLFVADMPSRKLSIDLYNGAMKFLSLQQFIA